MSRTPGKPLPLSTARSAANDVFMQLGRALAQARERQGLSITGVARLRGPAEGTTRQIESGYIRNVSALIDYLEIIQINLWDVLTAMVSQRMTNAEKAGDVRFQRSPALNDVVQRYELISVDGQRVVEALVKILSGSKLTARDATAPGAGTRVPPAEPGAAAKPRRRRG